MTYEIIEGPSNWIIVSWKDQYSLAVLEEEITLFSNDGINSILLEYFFFSVSGVHLSGLEYSNSLKV